MERKEFCSEISARCFAIRSGGTLRKRVLPNYMSVDVDWVVEYDLTGAYWVSFYMQDGTQVGETIFPNELPKLSGDDYKNIEYYLQEKYNDNYGGMADYGKYEEENDE